jgi:Fibronectin type III domain
MRDPRRTVILTWLGLPSAALFLVLSLTIPRASASSDCNGPSPTGLNKTELASPINLDGDMTSQPLGGTLVFTIPTTAISDAKIRLVACFRWKPLDDLAEENIAAAAQRASGQPTQQPAPNKKPTEQQGPPGQQPAVGAKSADQQNAPPQQPGTNQKSADQQGPSAQEPAAGAKPADQQGAPAQQSGTNQKPAEPQKEATKPKVWAPWSDDIPLHVVQTQSDLTTISVPVPTRIGGQPVDPLMRLPNSTLYTFNGIWPQAQFRVAVIAADNSRTLDEIVDVGITNRWLPAVAAAVGTVAFWIIIWVIAGRRQIPGNFLLSVISTKYGYASLSQLQIMLWTVVIVAGLIYVMVLTGRLLDVPTPTLALLGIAGASAVAAKIPKPDGAQTGGAAAPPPAAAAPPPPAAQPPGVVKSPRMVGSPGDTRAVLSWTPPGGGGTAVSYAVSYRQPGAAAWTPAPNGGAVTEAPLAVTGLTAGTAYEFQVIAVNAGGQQGPAASLGPVTTAAAAAAAPGQVQGLACNTRQAARGDRIQFAWNPLAPAPDAYVARFRRAGDTAWTVANVTTPGPVNAAADLIVDGLLPATDYEFQVMAVSAGLIGPPSAVATGRTAARTPKVRDLVVWDGTNEIDVTRLQMLLFTLVAGIFVGMKIVTLNQIPSIPDGLLMLMGLSNGVYVTSKYVSGQRPTQE